jgi:hypothetical protein
VPFRAEASLIWDAFVATARSLNLIICIQDLELAEKLKAEGIKWYWQYPVSSYYELESLIEMAPSYILLDAPLFFDLPQVQEKLVGTSIRLRAIPYRAHNNRFLKHKNGMFGTWIRPEDQEIYTEFISVLDFAAITESKKAGTIFKIYKSKKWNGNLALLIEDLNIQIDNRIIFADLAKKRIQCNQNCLRSGFCRSCHRAFAEAKRIQKIYREKDNN